MGIQFHREFAIMKILPVIKKFFLWSFIGLFLLLFVIILLHWQTNVVSNGIKNYLDHSLKGKAQVTYRSLSGTLIHSVKIKKIAITTPNGMKIMANYLELRYRLFPLIRNQIEISKIILDRLQIILPQNNRQKAEKPFSLDSLLARLQTHYLPRQLLGELPKIDLQNLEVISAKVSIKGQPMTFTNIYLNLAKFQLRPNRIFIRLTNFSGHWQERNLNLKSLSFVLKGNENGINLNQGELRGAKSNIFFNALLEPNSGVNLNLTQFYLDLDEIAKQAPIGLFRHGYLKGSLALSGIPLRFGIQAELEGRVDWRKISALSLLLRYDRGEIFLDKWHLASNFGNVKAHGYWNQQKRIIGRVNFTRVNLNAILSKLPQTRLNGRLSLNASNLFFKRLTGFGALSLYNCSIEHIKIDSVRMHITAKNGFLTFKEPSFIKIADSSKFYLTGTLDNQQNIDFSLLTFDNSLPQLLRNLGAKAVKGRFDGRIHLFGPLANPNFLGDLFLPQLLGYGALLDTLKFNLFIQGIARQRFGSGDFEIASGKIGNFPLDHVSFHLESRKNTVTINKLRFISGKNFFNTSLRIHWTLDSLNIAVYPFKIQYQKYWIAANDTLEVNINAQEATLEEWTFVGPGNSGLVINGFYDMDLGDFQTFITVKHLQITPFEQLLNTQLHVSGSLDGYAEILTPLSDLNAEIDLRADSLKVKNILLGKFISKFQFANQSLTIDTLSLSDGNSNIQADGSFALKVEKNAVNFLQGTKADFNLEWQNINLKHYAPLLKGVHKLKGRTSGFVKVQGIVNEPEIQSNILVDDFAAEELNGDSLIAKMHYHNGYIHLDSFSVILDSSRFAAQGWQKFDLSPEKSDEDILKQPFELHVWSHDNQLMFLGALNKTIESVQGPYTIDLTLSGTPEKPAIKKGTIQLRDGQVLLSMIRDPIKNVRFDASIDHSILTIKKAEAHSAEEKDFWQKAWALINSVFPWGKHSLKEGLLQANGRIDLSDLSRPKFDLNVELNKFYIDYFIQDISLIASSKNLSIHGQDTIFVEGDLYIPKGMFEVDLAQLSRNVYLTEETVTPIPPFLSLNLRVEIPGNFIVTSSPLDLTNNFHLTFMGDLVITMQPPSEEPRILGHLEATNGKYSSWNQNFVVESATLDFKNNPVPNPDINFTAFKILGNRTFELSMTGNLKHLNQSIRVLENGQELNLSYFDKIALLTIGTDISTLQSNVDSTLRNVGENIATTSILTAMERSAEHFTGLDKVEISSNASFIDLNRFRLNNGLSNASIAFGKYLTSDLYVEYRTQFGSNIPAPRLSWEAGNRLGLQYRINRNWSLDSYYEITQKGNTRIKFGLSWEYSF